MNRQYGALSGVAIFLVVLNHAVQFGLDVSPVTGVWRQVLSVLQALGVFAVPAFLFVSGAFLAYSARELSVTFLRNSLARLLVPYVVWSSIFYILLYAMTGERYSIAGYAKNLLVGYPYHFVPLLAFWYLTSPIVIRLGRRYGLALLLGIVLWQTWLLAVRFPEWLGPMPRWSAPPVLFIPMSDWAIYFPLGLVLTLQGTAKARLVRWRAVAGVATAGLLVLGLANAFGLVWAPWARFAAPVPLMFLLPTVERGWIPFFASFERLGRRSYGVYLAHFVIINALAFAIGNWLPWLGRLPILAYPVLLIATLGLSMLLMDVAARSTAGRRAYRYLFGIVPPPLARV
jgi:fucose 4-O-acetylase-like acetyltransferase